MVTTLVLIVSGILIGAGFSIIWRDVQKHRRRAFVSARDGNLPLEPEIEITISRRAAGTREPATALPPALPAAPPSPPPAVSPSQPSGASDLERRWAALQPALEAGVAKVNASLAGLGVALGPSGEPTWSYRNRGYGAYRRVLLGKDSVAWLRLELGSDGQLGGTVKAHKEEKAEVNAMVGVPADGLNEPQACSLLLQCLERTAQLAGRGQRHGGEEEASRQAWESVEGIVTAALKATNGALSQAGAKLLPLAPAGWENETQRHRMTLSVEVNGEDVARMHIERLPEAMEVAVGVRQPHLVDLGRRRRVPVDGLTIHALAELIAGCAWPAISRFKEMKDAS
jgi:hypothetical protein